MKKGFTLIELLAVIVILAIIALIATPLVLNIINASKIKKYENDVRTYIRAIETEKVSEALKGENYLPLSGVFDLSSLPPDMITGLKAKDGCFTIEEGIIKSAKLNIEDYFYTYSKEDGIKYDKDMTKISCLPEIFNDTYYGNKIWKSIYRDKYKEIIFDNKIDTSTDNLVAEFDLSKNNDNSIKGRIISDTDGMYILHIQSDGGYIKATNMKDIFKDFKNVTKITNLKYLNTGAVQDFSRAFYNMNKLEELDLTSFVTSNATNMSRMFARTFKLSKLDISKLDTKNVTDMSAMFSEAHGITKLDLTSFNTSKLENMEGMFSYMDNVTEINISGIDVRKVTNASSLITGAIKFKKLIARDLDFKSLQKYSFFMYGLYGFENGEIDFKNTYFNPTGTEETDTQYAFSRVSGPYDVRANVPETKAFLETINAIYKNMNFVD